MRQQRTERIEKELASLEAEFRDKLIVALRNCANRQWGLFAQNSHIEPRYDRSPAADELLEMGEAIEDLRRQAGIPEAFPLYAEFKAERGRKDGNARGESRLAQEWLLELGE